MVTYPLAMPNTGVAYSDFELAYVDATTTLRSGMGFSTELAPAYWEVQITTSNLTRRTERWRLWRRFIDALRGSKKLCLLYDPDLPLPQNYTTLNGLTKANTVTAFDGTGDVNSVTDPHTYVISGLPANFVFLAADYIGFIKNGRYSLHRLVDDTTADIDGIATVNVEPEVPAYFDADATFNVYKPYGEFILDGKPDAGRGLEGGSISFRAKSRVF